MILSVCCAIMTISAAHGCKTAVPSPHFQRGEEALESRDYKKILNALPETSVFVIREADHGILYFNKWVQDVSPGVRLGMACHEIWTGSCSCCPLLTIRDRLKSRSVSYNSLFGGVVNITASRTMWQDSIPAFVVTVSPRTMTAGFTYRKILRLDLCEDRGGVIKSDPEGWQPGEGPLSEQLEQFARGGFLHPEDADRFVAFTRLDALRTAARSGKDAATLLYRRRSPDGGFRWNLMEVIPDSDQESRSAVLCVKDIHDVLREALEREEVSARSQELIRSLGERNFDLYVVDLGSGRANPIRVDGQMRDGLSTLAWSELVQTQIREQLHPDNLEEFSRRFSLEGLRRGRDEGRQEVEMLARWRTGEDYRYISITAYFGRELGSHIYTVVALQDVDERVRRDLIRTQRDMQIAAIVKSRYRMMNTVHLDSGQCERVNLDEAAGAQEALVGDYSHYIQQALERAVMPEDAELFRSSLSMEHLREKAAETEEYAEETFRYRLKGEPVRWVELHVIYSRRDGQTMVNILGRDVTRELIQEETKRRALEDRAYVISSMSRLFFSVYYIDVEKGTFRAVTQLSRVGDVLGSEVNFSTALQIYANNFIDPDDREEYLRVMDVENLRQSLRWWQPYVAMEYRKLAEAPGEEHSWVRATAVLAQAGEDDLPRTALYVAQDISQTKRSAK